MKKLANLEGAKKLNKKEQISISGGNCEPNQYETQRDCWRNGQPYCYPLNNGCWGAINWQ